MKDLSVLDALNYLKENPADFNLAQAIAAAFDDRLDELDGVMPKNAAQEDALEEEIDAVSELADLMLAVMEECKAYAKAVKTDSEADDSSVQDVLIELEDYLNAYDDNYKHLDKMQVEL